MRVFLAYLVFWDDETAEKVSAVVLFRLEEVEGRVAIINIHQCPHLTQNC